MSGVADFLAGLTSSDVDVMRQAVDIVKERAAVERERGMSAERRAGSVLVALGILAAFAVLVGQTLGADLSTRLNVLTGGLFTIALLFLGRSAYYALRINGVAQPNILSHALTETIQVADRVDALRLEIAWRRWEIDQSVPANTQKLFWLARAQRNAIGAMFGLMALAAAGVLHGLLPPAAVPWLGWALVVIGTPVVFIIDSVLEERSFWQWKWDA